MLNIRYGDINIEHYIRNKTNRYFSDLLCHKCCKLLGIRSKARIKRHKAGKEHEIYPNLLHDFDASRPFEKVCTDTTILTHKSGKYDWNLYIDLFDNTIIAYDIRRSNYGLSPINHYNAAKNFLDEKEIKYLNTKVKVHQVLIPGGLIFYSYCSKYAMIVSDVIASLFAIKISINVS
ncbi:hypothetical protein [Acholeplasma equifetale]|uniref:hypothetical protein n=1 Tax=Acholeplasma equifetale TaxID=264634 RepID=UPI00068C07C7|nr:hypothetical protein [Acholeplasma equifetale]